MTPARFSRAVAVVVTAGVALGGCIPLRLQETPPVSGIVVDASGGRPISGVRVYFLSSPECAAVTAADGRFSLAATSRWHLVPLLGVADRFDRARLVAEARGFEPDARQYAHHADRREERISLTPSP